MEQEIFTEEIINKELKEEYGLRWIYSEHHV